MNAAQIMLILISMDLFMFYGVEAMGGIAPGGGAFAPFVDAATLNGHVMHNASLNVGSLVDIQGLGGVGMLISGGLNAVLNVLAPVLGFLSWAFNILTMPFTIAWRIGLTGAAAAIPSVLYVAALTFALAKFVTGRE